MTAVGATVQEVLANAFAERPDLRSYLLDDRDQLRKHMALFVDGQQIADRSRLSDAVGSDSHLHFLQALSGG